MYMPSWSHIEDTPTLHAFMQQHSFATLVTTADNGPEASHLPFLLDTIEGAFGTLRAHLARANSQWRRFEEGREALVIFQGPHAYISPTWYETQPSVPTWNYAVVHAYGIPRLLDETALRALLTASIAQYDAAPEAIALPEDYLQKMVTGIIGFEIAITRLEGKFKMSQNKPEADQQGVIAALAQADDANTREVAAWMSDNNTRPE